MVTLGPPPLEGPLPEPLKRWLRQLWDTLRAAGAGASIATAAATTPQTLADSAWTKVNFNVVEIDTDSAVTTGADWKWTCPTTGTYLLSAAVALNNAGVAGITFRVHLTKNQAVAADGGFAGWIQESTPTNYAQAVIPATAVELEEGDFVTVVAQQTNGGAASRDLLAGERFCRFSAVRIA